MSGTPIKSRSQTRRRMDFPLAFFLLIVAAISLTGGRASGAADLQQPQWSGTLAQIQFPTSPEESPTDYRILYKAAGVVCSTILVSFLCWFVAYPTILRRGNTWPVTLYGRCTGVAWCISWLIALAIFWNDLPIDPRDTFLRAQGLRWLLGIVAVFFAVVWTLVWRSEKQAIH